MAAGVPIVATKAGGLPELVESGVSGHLCDVGDTEAMADSVLAILSSKEKFSDIRSSTLERAQEFRIDFVLPKYLDIYNRVLNEY